MTLEELMQELGSRLGLGEVQLDEDGGAQIVVDDDLDIDIARAEEGSGFSLSAVVGPLHANDREAELAELLAANLLGRGTGGAALSLDDALDEIVLSRIVAQDDLPFEVFEQELTTFIEVLRIWRDRHRQDLIGKGDVAARAVASDGSSLIPSGGIIKV